MAGTAVRFRNPYSNYDPNTIFQVDQATKTLSPFSSGKAYTDAGFQFGQEQLVEDPNQYSGFSVGPIINDRAAALASVKNDLNSFQAQAYGQPDAAPKRASSSAADRIAAEQQGLDADMAEFASLKKRYEELSAPNYQDAYAAARSQAGIPGLEQQYAGVRQQRREQPYVTRANVGNAGVTTEGQLGAQVQQADIPLGIQEQNTIDRLQLASDFVNQALKFKELDANSARTAIENAISLVSQSVSMHRTGVQDAQAQREQEQSRSDQALQFRTENGINTPFFNAGGTIYDSGSLEGIPDEKTFQQKYGMTLQEAEAKGLVGKLDSGKQKEQALVLDLASNYPDAGITTSDTLQAAQSKITRSRIYQDQVRAPAGSGGGGGGGSAGVLGLTNQQIDNISPLVTQFQNSPIVQNYNVIGETINTLRSLGSSPTDDIQRIYAFAKVMDPGSAVREGEYKTVQDYATALLQRTGLNARRVFDNSGFLTKEARTFLSNTIQNRFSAAETSYKNLYSETERRINLVGGTDKGTQLLNNYGGAFTPPKPKAGEAGFTGPVPAQPAQQQKSTQSTWSKITNWLWGE